MLLFRDLNPRPSDSCLRRVLPSFRSIEARLFLPKSQFMIGCEVFKTFEPKISPTPSFKKMSKYKLLSELYFFFERRDNFDAKKRGLKSDFFKFLTFSVLWKKSAQVEFLPTGDWIKKFDADSNSRWIIFTIFTRKIDKLPYLLRPHTKKLIQLSVIQI